MRLKRRCHRRRCCRRGPTPERAQLTCRTASASSHTNTPSPHTQTHHTQTDADNATWCAPLAIVVSTDWWLHKFVDDRGAQHYLWDRPDALWDTDR